MTRIQVTAVPEFLTNLMPLTRKRSKSWWPPVLNEGNDDIGCVITFGDAGSTKLGHNSMTKEVTTAIITTEWILLKDQKKV